VKTDIPDVLVIEPRVFADDRGFFFESWSAAAWHNITGLETTFVQDNHSRSIRGVVRGLHYQINHVQGKLVRVISGEIFDVAVDLRRSSPTFGRWGRSSLLKTSANSGFRLVSPMHSWL
jgi:dTDP-4-dehydrorhamnose 3,5-epimerase